MARTKRLEGPGLILLSDKSLRPIRTVNVSSTVLPGVLFSYWEGEIHKIVKDFLKASRITEKRGDFGSG